ncbi:MAG TPA: beta-ketoacyl-[acyl-carrier-protein] synthase family protein [Thermoanaerobaculia bacterium]|jgi:3-oxoacyl-[acyl-carrier-protein] synthase II|nr:beta-ketoacyl-[acyl-carrier-protein] synthase family protein [Thermoanaerobaculia bacterium]
MISIAVTGLGLTTPIGLGHETFWPELLAGRSGFRPVGLFDTSRHGTHLGAEVQNFDPAAWVRRSPVASMGRASHLAISAARMALADAGVDPEEISAEAAERFGVMMGTTSGEPLEIERFSDLMVGDRLDELGGELAGRYPCHLIAANVASELGFSGPNQMIPTACAAGNYAIAYAVEALRTGRADLMLAGGADSFSRMTYTGFGKLGAIAPDVVRPFSKNRKGMIPGEGSGVLVLESTDRARARGARIYAEIAGYGITCDAHHMTAAHPQGDGPARAMERALAASGLAPADISYVSAHGTGTPTNDKLETLAVHRVFGRGTRVPISSIKSMIGHTMGAASAIEAAVCALGIHEGWVPPTMNYDEADPECDLDCVPNQARQMKVDVAMNNAYAFGGNNASLILRRPRA